MPAIDHIQPVLVQVEADVTQGHEAFQVDQMLHHLGMGQRHDLLGLGKRAFLG